jgi:hypothetical protein
MKKRHICIVFIVLAIYSMGSISAEEGTTSKDAKALIKGNEVQFVDKEGKTTGKISLESETKFITKQNRISGNNQTQKIKQIIYKHAIASKNGKNIAVIESATDIDFVDNEQKEHSFYGEGETTGKVILYDAQGKMLFEKQVPKGRGIYSGEVISENGEVIAVNTFDTIRETNEPRDIIFVFNQYGKVILTIPSNEENSKYTVRGIEKTSQNGKYLAVTLSTGTRFYNLANGKFWDTPKDYYIYEIKDNGKAIVGSKNIPGKEDPIYLENYIGD